MAEDTQLDPEIEKLSEKYAKDPKSRVFAPLGDAYRRSKLYDEAINILKKGLELYPNYVSAHLVLGRCYYEKNMYQLAKDEFEKVLQLDQQNLVALNFLGDILANTGNKDEAIETYKQILEIDTTNTEVREKLEAMVPGVTALPAAEMPPGAEPPPIKHGFEETQPIEPTPIAETKKPEVPVKPIVPSEEPPSAAEPSAEEPPVKHIEKEKTTLIEAPPSEPKKPVATPTLAEIYENQGFLDKALEVYKEVLQSSPDNEKIKAKVAELESKLSGKESPKEKPEKLTDIFAEKKEKEQKPKKDMKSFKDWLEGLK